MAAVQVYKGFSKVYDAQLGRSMVKCSYCLCTFEKSTKLSEHMQVCAEAHTTASIPASSSPQTPSSTGPGSSSDPHQKFITDKIYDFIEACGLPLDIIEHPAAVDMFNALRTTFNVPSKVDLLKRQEKQGDNGFNDLYDYVDVYGLTAEQCNGLMELFVNRYPEEGYPENYRELLARRRQANAYVDPLVFLDDSTNTQKSSVSPSNKRGKGKSWIGFHKVYNEKMQRNVAQCTKCLVVIKNTSRVESHRLKCYGNVVCPDEQSENDFNQTTESVVTDLEKDIDTTAGDGEEDWVSIIAGTADKEQQDNCKQEVVDVDMDEDDDGEEEEVEEYVLMMPAEDGDSIANGFEKVYDEKLRRNIRQCSLCNTKIKNVSMSRLNAHRLKCSGLKRSSSSIDKWKGFSKVYVEKFGRNVAQCNKCTLIIRNATETRFASHRSNCKGEISPKVINRVNWEGFEKIYNDRMGRNVGQCKRCSTMVMNASRLQGHRLKCNVKAIPMVQDICKEEDNEAEG